MSKCVSFLKSRSAQAVGLVTTASLVASTSAYAALPAGVATFFTGITDDFAELLDTYMYPLLFAVTGAIIIFGLVRRGAKKATAG